MNCIIIAGANGEIGKEFINKFLQKNKILAISKHEISAIIHPNLKQVVVDLTNPKSLEESFLKFDPSDYERIIFIHSIGRDMFENTNYPKIEPLNTINPAVYASNVNTYKYLAKLLIKKIGVARKTKPVKLKIVMIGSVADKYGLLVMTSFSESKNIIRSYIKDAVKIFPWVSGLAINVSSTITKSAIEVRPHANTKYWLTPKEVVDRSWKEVLSHSYWNRYKEINIYKKDPEFNNEYYFDDKAVFDKWTKDVLGK